MVGGQSCSNVCSSGLRNASGICVPAVSKLDVFFHCELLLPQAADAKYSRRQSPLRALVVAPASRRAGGATGFAFPGRNRHPQTDYCNDSTLPPCVRVVGRTLPASCPLASWMDGATAQ